MATPADQRLLELLARWLESLELHTKYSSLDDDSYWKIQPWTEHQRPTRWIIDLAKQKTVTLRAQVEERIKAGDARFSDALELMAFLANLVGSEHIERFIPVADKQNERPLSPTPPVQQPIATAQPGTTVTATREMPKFPAAKRPPPPAGTAQVARTERKAAAPAKTAAKAPPKPPAKKPGPPPERTGPSDADRELVIADAIRLVQWGRKWYELAEIIARMADRPSLPDVRRILKEHKLAIEKKVSDA
jgi:hypothetical protein